MGNYLRHFINNRKTIFRKAFKEKYCKAIKQNGHIFDSEFPVGGISCRQYKGGIHIHRQDVYWWHQGVKSVYLFVWNDADSTGAFPTFFWIFAGSY